MGRIVFIENAAVIHVHSIIEIYGRASLLRLCNSGRMVDGTQPLVFEITICNVRKHEYVVGLPRPKHKVSAEIKSYQANRAAGDHQDRGKANWAARGHGVRGLGFST